MAISDYTEQFAGKPVEDWDADKGLSDPSGTLPRLSISYDDHEQKILWTDKFAAFLDHPDATQVTGLVIGAWDFEFSEGSSAPVVEALVAARDRLPNLSVLFFGDITYEECEMSWIRQSDISPLFEAFPKLEHFAVRGGEGLVLGAVRHERLKTLVIETGGLDAEVARGVCACQLPALEHLELWLGTDDYGRTVEVADLRPILNGELFPKLHTLALRNANIADAVAQAVASAPILERLQTLDLSLGTLTDEGAQALLDSPAVARLQKLDIHHHFCSDAMVEKLRALSVDLNADEPQDAEEYGGETYRYVSVGE